ncbi:MAG: cupin domain-containing protein [Candidatus Latescibacteria bacterium]|nr:cupin domain-containing protein [Candidatus Latescibacterota bacterium]NIM21695.1 cupin domain-containing protein [Candidatus Latescibacterota bacterium]NIM65722.1 cupin domain-containing protein [Candidatus Latescibacterota bacterium]NIO02107.1 cupin domain-containing protein [Candidatus Latescibacterota bacterium]NIO28924.1 cupin domain-containing protein [Candidatus Latescibacterota bacterium]
MFVRDYRRCREITAGDGTRLRELFNPLKDDIELDYSFAIARLAPGEASILHRLKSSEIYYVLVGEGEIHIGGDQAEIRPGQTIYVPPNAAQRVKNTGDVDLAFICIVNPAWKTEDEEILE